jgi:hypothetical protein
VTGANRREQAEALLEGGDGDGAIFWNECDAAIVGVCDGRVVYEWASLVQVFVAQGMTEEEAEEWVSFNIAGAYLGKGTPLLMTGVTGEER